MKLFCIYAKHKEDLLKQICPNTTLIIILHGYHIFGLTNTLTFPVFCFPFSSILFNKFNKYKNIFNKYTSIKKKQRKLKIKTDLNSFTFPVFWVKFPDFSLTGKCVPSGTCGYHVGTMFSVEV